MLFVGFFVPLANELQSQAGKRHQRCRVLVFLGIRPMPIRANRAPMRGEAVATANGADRISPLVPNNANPKSVGDFMATTPKMVHPASVCGHSLCEGEAPWDSMALPDLTVPASAAAKQEETEQEK